MFQRRSLRTAPRVRSLAVGGALAAFAVVGGGTVVAVSAPGDVTSGDVRLTQNVAGQELALGTAVSIDLEPVVARAAGGAVPPGTTVQVTGLPDGLTQDGWTIAGTPTRAGTYDVLVTVANSGLTRSQTVAVTVADGAGESTDPTSGAPGATTREAGEGEVDDDEATTSEDGTTEGDAPGASDDGAAPEATATDEESADEAEGEETGGDEAGETTTPPAVPDLCAALGGEGRIDGASLASMLGGEGEAVPAGVLTVIVDALAGMLPGLLGDTGSVGDAACAIQPALTGESAEGADAGTDTGTGTGGLAESGAAALGVPTALLGLLGAGSGSLGG